MEWNSFLEIPLDESNYRYHQSFTVDEIEDSNNNNNRSQAREFFDRYGFWIVRDVLTTEECQVQANDMDSFLQETGKGLATFGTPKGVNSLFRPALLQVRQHPNILRALSSALQTNDIIVSHDRWLMHQPPADSMRPLTKRNIHVDFNPWEYFDLKDDGTSCNHNRGYGPKILARLDVLNYSKNDRAFIAENNDIHHSMGPCLQAIVNLSDLPDASYGGTIVVPGSHLTWQCRFNTRNVDVQQRQVGPMQYKFDEGTQSLAQHVKIRPGSLLLWDQRLAHGSTPNLSPHHTRRGIPFEPFRHPSCHLDEPLNAQGRCNDKFKSVVLTAN